MSTILDSIIEGVLEDIKLREIPLSEIRRKAEEAGPLRGARRALTGSELKIISEVKRSSPSKGPLAEIPDPATLARQYQEAGASVISVLTEQRRFKGSIGDFLAVRNAVEIPLLRKDFIVSEFQIFESRAICADLLLLIVAGLSQSQYLDYYQMASELGMDILVEVHSEDELERALEAAPSIVGVNSRNLKTLELDSQMFDRLIPKIPEGIIKIAESGISTRSEVAHIETLGTDAILVGETLVRAGDARSAIKGLLGTL